MLYQGLELHLIGQQKQTLGRKKRESRKKEIERSGLFLKYLNQKISVCSAKKGQMVDQL